MKAYRLFAVFMLLTLSALVNAERPFGLVCFPGMTKNCDEIESKLKKDCKTAPTVKRFDVKTAADVEKLTTLVKSEMKSKEGKSFGRVPFVLVGHGGVDKNKEHELEITKKESVKTNAVIDAIAQGSRDPSILLDSCHSGACTSKLCVGKTCGPNELSFGTLPHFGNQKGQSTSLVASEILRLYCDPDAFDKNGVLTSQAMNQRLCDAYPPAPLRGVADSQKEIVDALAKVGVKSLVISGDPKAPEVPIADAVKHFGLTDPKASPTFKGEVLTKRGERFSLEIVRGRYGERYGYTVRNTESSDEPCVEALYEGYQSTKTGAESFFIAGTATPRLGTFQIYRDPVVPPDGVTRASRESPTHKQ